jgi:hypothetical protein
MEMSAIRDLLKDVPQSPRFHPEGSVGIHTRLVKKALPQAVSLMQNAIHTPDSPFSNFSPEYSSREINILRLVALTHDIGKASATAWTNDEKGYQAIGHEDLSHLIPGFRKLKASPIWNKLYQSTNEEDRRIFMFLIRNHMTKFGKGDQNQWIDDKGKYKNDIKIKLLLTFVLMDHLGRGDVEGIIGQKNGRADLEKMTTAAAEKQKRANRIQVNANIPSDVEGFVNWLKEQGKPAYVMRLALQGKFPHLSAVDIDKLIS